MKLMKSNYVLENKTNFRMKGSDFNTLLNSIKIEGEGENVSVALTVRTPESNLVLTKNGSLLFKTPVMPYKETEGAFSVLLSLQALIDMQLNLSGNDVVNHTVLLPIGAYKTDRGITLYYHLIIKDELIEKLNSKDSMKFENIEELELQDENLESIMVVPTLTVVK